MATPGEIEEKVGEKLVEIELLTNEQFTQALAEAREQNKSLRRILVGKGLVTNETYVICFALCARVRIVDIQHDKIERAAVNMIPESVALEFKVLPVSVAGDFLLVAMHNPTDVEAIKILAMITGKRIRPCILMQEEEDIEKLIAKFYENQQQVRELLDLLGGPP